MDIRAIDLIIGVVGSLPFLAIAGYILRLEYKRGQRSGQLEQKPTP